MPGQNAVLERRGFSLGMQLLALELFKTIKASTLHMSKPKAGFSRNLPEQKNVYGHGNATTRNEPVKSKTNNRRFIKGAPETFLL